VCLFIAAVSSYLHLRPFTLRELEEALMSPGDNPFFSALLTRLLIKDRSLRSKLSSDEGLDWPLTGALLRETVRSWYERREKVWGLVENTLTRTRSTIAPAPGAIERVLGGHNQNELRKKMASPETSLLDDGQERLAKIPLITDILHAEPDAKNKFISIQLLPLIKDVHSFSSSSSSSSSSVPPALPSLQLPTAVSVTEATASSETVEINMMVDVDETEASAAAVTTSTTAGKPRAQTRGLSTATASASAAPSSSSRLSKQRIAGTKRKEADSSAFTPGEKEGGVANSSSASAAAAAAAETGSSGGGQVIVTPPTTSKRGGGKRKGIITPYVFPVSDLPDHAPGFGPSSSSSSTSSSSSSYLSNDLLELKAKGGSLKDEEALLAASATESSSSSSSSSLSFSSLPSPSLSFNASSAVLVDQHLPQTRGLQQAQETSLVELYKQDLKNAMALTDDDIYNTLLDLPHDEADEEDVAEAYEWDALLEPLGALQDPLAKTRFVDAPLKLRMSILQTLIDGRAGDWNDDICQFLIAYADNGNDCDRLRLRELGTDGHGAIYYSYPRMSSIAQQEVRIFREYIYRVPTSGRLVRSWTSVATDLSSLEILIKGLGPYSSGKKTSSTNTGSNTTGSEKILVQALLEIRELHTARVEKEIARKAYEERRKEGKVGQVPEADDSIFEAEEAAERAREAAAKEAQAAKAAAAERARIAAEQEAIIAAESLANTRKRRSSAIKQDAVHVAAVSEIKQARSEHHHHHHEKKPYSGPTSVTFERLLHILERLPHHEKVIAIQYVLRSTPEHDRFVVMSPNALPHNRRVVASAARDMLVQLKEMAVEREENRLRRVEKDFIRKKKEAAELEKFRADKEEASRKLAASIQQGRGDRAIRRDGGLTVADQARLDRQQEVIEKRSLLTAAIETAKQNLVKLQEKVQENIAKITRVSASLVSMDPTQMARVSQEIQVFSAENVELMNEVNAQHIRVQESEQTLKQYDDTVNLFLQGNSGEDFSKKSYLEFIKVRNEFLMQPSKIRLRIKLQVPIAPGGYFLSGKRILQAFMHGSPWIDKATEYRESLNPGLRWLRGEAALRSGQAIVRPSLPQAGPDSLMGISSCFLGEGAASGRPLEEPPKYFGSGRYGSKKQQGMTSPNMMSPNMMSPNMMSPESGAPSVSATLVGDRVEAVPHTSQSTQNTGLFLKLRFSSTIRPPSNSLSIQQPAQGVEQTSTSTTTITTTTANTLAPIQAVEDVSAPEPDSGMEMV